jgi:hypothetical protein
LRLTYAFTIMVAPLAWLRCMPEVLTALVAFVAEHQRCGDLDGGRDSGYVWLQCSCSALIMQPEREPLARTALASDS